MSERERTIKAADESFDRHFDPSWSEEQHKLLDILLTIIIEASSITGMKPSKSRAVVERILCHMDDYIHELGDEL